MTGGWYEMTGPRGGALSPTFEKPREERASQFLEWP